MALDIGTDLALRGLNDLRRLLDAVVSADEHDEVEWIEWKSTLDLSGKDGCFTIARTILGMANRLPDAASLACEGLGYIVVGAAPASVDGIQSVDPAHLDARIDAYLGGADGPRWTPTYVTHDEATVLMVTVEAPRFGDPIFSLRKEFDVYPSGAVFVRKKGRTVRAIAEDMDALQRRLLAKPRATKSEIAVRPVGNVPLSWIDPTSTESSIEGWVSEQRDRLVRDARRLDHVRHSHGEEDDRDDLDGVLGATGIYRKFARQQDSVIRMMQQANSLSRLTQQEDTRTLEEFIDQVDRWAEGATEVAGAALPERYVAAGHGVIAFEIENLSMRFLPDVELEVYFGFENARGFDEEPERHHLPRLPRPFGEPKQTMDFSSAVLSPHFATPFSPSFDNAIGRRTWVEDGSIKVRFHVGDLRPHATDTSDEIYVFLTERPEGGVLTGTWTATMRDQDGLLEGQLEVPIAEEPVDIPELLSDDEDDE